MLPRGAYEYFGRTPQDREQITGVSLGHVDLLAGRAAEAIPLLRGIVNDCLAMTTPVEHVQARMDLAAALEQTGDLPGACESYARVVAQWGHARPRSVTAEAARKAIKRLQCAGAAAAK
jgi:serine/threonine-protein kinase